MAKQNENVSLKKKVTLRQKQSEASSSPNSTAPQNKSKKGLWLIPVAILIAGGALVLANKGGDDNATQVAKANVPPSMTENATSSVVSDDAKPSEDSFAIPSSSKDESSVAEETSNNDVKPGTKETDARTNATKANAPSGAATSIPVSKGTKTGAPVKSESNSETNTTAVSLSSSLDENALRVVRGEFGNGQKRKETLGDRYTEIQTRVNEMYREGRFN